MIVLKVSYVWIHSIRRHLRIQRDPTSPFSVLCVFIFSASLFLLGIYIVYFFAVYLFMGMRYVYTSVVCWILFVTFNIMNYQVQYVDNANSKQWMLSLGYLLLTNVMLMLVSFLLESSQRSAYLKMQRYAKTRKEEWM